VAGNKIGIEVQVEFQTIGELQAQLAEKWKRVKNNFVGKINVDVDGTSLNQMKAKIKRALSDEVIDIKLSTNMSEAFGELNNFRQQLKKLDAELGKTRELKVNVAGLDVNKAFKDVLQDMKQIDKLQQEANKKTAQPVRRQCQTPPAQGKRKEQHAARAEGDHEGPENARDAVLRGDLAEGQRQAEQPAGHQKEADGGVP
jgi:hypothetical protein